LYKVNSSTFSWEYTVYKGIYDYKKKLDMSYHLTPSEHPTQEEVNTKIIMRQLADPIQLNTVAHIILSYRDQILKEGWTRDQTARAIISLVQSIPYDSESVEQGIIVGRLPYQVLYDNKGICEEKSLLLALMLKHLGYGVALLRFPQENHMAVGIKCPKEYGYADTEYCFIETTSPAFITDADAEYAGGVKLTNKPEVIVISEGETYTDLSNELSDLATWRTLWAKDDDTASWQDCDTINKLAEKYGLKSNCKRGF